MVEPRIFMGKVHINAWTLKPRVHAKDVTLNLEMKPGTRRTGLALSMTILMWANRLVMEESTWLSE
jgi:hypothetical protein